MPISYDLPQPNEPGSKLAAPPPPPGGTGFGGGGGFGSRGGGGSGYFGAPQASVFSAALGSGQQARRKIVMGPNGPVSIAYSPMVADNVPAMLTAGEGVLNNGAMAMPGMQDFLNAANAAGVQRMAEGGMVQDMAGGMGGDPDMLREILLKLLPILLGIQPDGAEDAGEGGGPEGMACGGMVKPLHMAFGGTVQRQYGGFGGGLGMRQNAPTMPRMPSGGLGTPQTTPKPGAVPLGSPGANTGAAGPGTLPNPWQVPALVPGSNNPGDEWKKRIETLLQQFGQGGFFSPGGSPELLKMVQDNALGVANAQNQQAMNQSRLLGLDPGQAGSYQAEAALRGQGNVANAMSNAQLQQLLGQQQFAQGLLGRSYDANTQAWLQRLAGWIQGGA